MEFGSNLAEFGGIGSISYGAWLIAHPAGFITAGCGLVLLGVAAGRPSP